LRIVGLFAGVAGLELGLERAGHELKAVAEVDPHAIDVLTQRFPKIRNLGNVETLKHLPPCDLLTAGFPCQDLSQAGNVAGIHGNKSGLVNYAFDLLEKMSRKPNWLLLENVPFMLSLHRGAGMSWLIGRLEKLGYRWAYRVIDARAFGLAQRRRRLFILASLTGNPAAILLSDRGTSRQPLPVENTPHGFYWTEGNRGVGWAIDAIPPLKCNSGIDIVAPPAIWIPKFRSIVIPTIEDAEALQGFPRGWTRAASVRAKGKRVRWRLVGNAVSVPVAEWLGRQLSKDCSEEFSDGAKMPPNARWPTAGYGGSGQRYMVAVSEWPGRRKYRGIMDYLSADAPALSTRATKGFLDRLLKSRLRVPHQFVADLAHHISSNEKRHNNGLAHKQKNGSHSTAGQSFGTKLAIGVIPKRSPLSCSIQSSRGNSENR
jgi:DNA (cytosine-5)-methyltransferase 1